MWIWIIRLGFITLVFEACVEEKHMQEDVKIKVEMLSQSGYFEELCKPYLEQYNIQNLESGFDSFQLRIWYDVALSDSIDIFIFSKLPDKCWNSFRIRCNKLNRTEIISCRKSESTIPSEQVLFVLDSIGIMDFTGMTGERIKSVADGEWICIEYATRNNYRRCESLCNLGYPTANDYPEMIQSARFVEKLYGAFMF